MLSKGRDLDLLPCVLPSNMFRIFISFISFLLGCINGSDDVFKRFILVYI